MELQVVYDGAIYPSSTNTSTRFTHGQFILFDSLDLAEDESEEFGVSLLAVIPVIGKTLIKFWDFQEVLNTDNLIRIPREFGESDYEFYLAFGTTVQINNFRVYVVTSDVTQETLDIKLDSVLSKLTEVQAVQVGEIANELAQNSALIVLGTSLIPITAGVSGGVVPILTGGITGFLPFIL